MDYVAKHTKALQKVRDNGAPVTFSQPYPATGNITGQAVELPGDPEEYQALELIGQEPITLFFVPDVFGDSPALRSVVPWAGKDRVVARIFPIRPDGTMIAARVVAT